jgi:glucokinase
MASAELGHVVVEADGPECFGNCPNRGCLEVMASGSALVRATREAAVGPSLLARDLLDRAPADDLVAELDELPRDRPILLVCT